MSKLLAYKKWVTVEEAARHLSIGLGELVDESDVYQLALQGKLTLSVDFVNHTYAKLGHVIRVTEADWHAAAQKGGQPEGIRVSRGIPQLSGGRKEWLVLNTRLDAERYLVLDEDEQSISGIWDLPMVGSERIDVEYKYHQVTDGPAVTLVNIEGTFVTRPDGKWAQLMTSWEENEHAGGSKAAGESLEAMIRDREIPREKADDLRSSHALARKDFLERKQDKEYFSAGGLPHDCVYVVRTSVLQDFIREASNRTEKSTNANERNSLLVVIAALCKAADIKYDGRGASTTIARLTEEIGARLTDDTVRKFLGKIPDALEAKSK